MNKMGKKILLVIQHTKQKHCILLQIKILTALQL